MLTTGRRAFQEFAEEFELWDKDKEGIRYIDLSKLDNKYCAVNVNTANQLKGIFNVTIGSSDKEKK